MSYSDIPGELLGYLYHGHEEVYLEYKGDIPWHSRVKMLEIAQTIFALANVHGGGAIIIGVEDNGNRKGLSDDNFNSYSHDQINQFLSGRGNQAIQCSVEKFEHKDTENKQLKKFIIIQVSECKEFPLVYTGHQELMNKEGKTVNSNIGLRTGALYIRNQRQMGNKEISTAAEWQELIERTYKKFEKESIRRYEIIKEVNTANRFDEELLS